jgi:ABC-type polysaccharide/polyol phosphate export permease
VSAARLSPAEAWVENRPTRGLVRLRARELWAYRELVYFLALRDIKARYKQAAFGIGWAVLQPVAGVATFTLVFGHLTKVRTGGVPYPVFALAGYLVWGYFAATISTATLSLVANSALVTKVYFPRLVAPLSALLPGLVNLLPGLVLLGVLMAFYGVAPHAALAALPLLLVALMAASLGVGLLLATLNVKYRDVGAVVGTLVNLLLFVSPVAYPATLLSQHWRWLYALNPMAGIIEGARWVLIGGPWPGADVPISLASAAVLLVTGLVYFQRTERRFADVI